MVRTSQGGSILSFIIIGVVLVLLLVGGAYFVRQKTQSPSGNAPVTTSPQTKAPAASDNKNTSDKNGAASPDSSSKQAVSPDTTDKSAASGGSSNHLPQTGPTETFSALVVLGLVSGVVTAYIRSRRAQPVTLTSL